MDTIAIGLHVFVCLFLVGVIMLQTGKGADIGATFGGGMSQTLFGGRGPATFLNKLTIIVSVLFLLTSVWLVKIGHKKGTESVIGNVPMQTEPAPAAPETPKTEPAKK